MKEENNTANSQERQKLLAHLRSAKELFVIISMHTRMPFVFCDPETFDDEVLLYKTEEEAQKGGKLLLARKDPVNIAKLENRHLLSFYSNLFTMMRKDPEQQMTEELKEMQEELLVDLQRGKYLLPVEPDKGLLVMKQKDGSVFQPVFTDPDEFRKFNRENKYRTAVVEYAKLPDILPPEAKGVIVNPLGVNIPFHIARPKKTETK